MRLISRLKRAAENPVADVVVAYAALLSVIVILVDLASPLSEEAKLRIYVIDLLLVSILVGDLIVRALASGRPLGYVSRRAYEIPGYIPIVVLDLIEDYLVGVGLLRLARVFRLARLVVAVSRGSRMVRKASRVAGTMHLKELGLVILATLVSGATAVYIVEYPVDESPIKSYSDALWWAIVTATTVGYGDIVPATALGKAIGVSMMILGISTLSIAISALGAVVMEVMRPDEGGGLKEDIKRRIDSIGELSEEELERLIVDLRALWRESRVGGRGSQ